MMKYVECNRDSFTLRGMLHIPEGASAENKVPMVIILNGFGGDRNDCFGILVKLSRMLCQEGIASARFDYMGSGESDGDFSDMSILTETKDAECILQYVKTLEFVDAGKIALHGFSQGGMVAFLTAAKHPDEIVGISTWAPALCIHDCCRDRDIMGVSIKDIEEKGWVDYHGTRLGEIYYRDGINSNVYDVAANYRGPVQIVHGKADSAVPFMYSVKMKNLLGDACTLQLVDGMDHVADSVEFNEIRLAAAYDFLKKVL